MIFPSDLGLNCKANPKEDCRTVLMMEANRGVKMLYPPSPPTKCGGGTINPSAKFVSNPGIPKTASSSMYKASSGNAAAPHSSSFTSSSLSAGRNASAASVAAF
ncbi:hypothetical protein RJ639_027951 [Escallonia herrerae]|uniref:Uncharacterized protein n=1 Tax=Escallonia herrerae TaxID=1293975 RepID=A0AA88X3Z1_9ASTE|nr:hypothetical protein RJ639_027951 [Escallonia herrerae]